MADPQFNADEGMNNLAALYKLISKNTSTETTTGNISQAGQQALLSGILGGTNGLAQVAQGAHAAGGYNSTVNQQLVNDLLARSTAEVAAKSAGTTTVKQTPQSGAASALQTALALKGIYKTGSGFLSSPTGKKLLDSLGFGDAGASTAGAAGDVVFGGTGIGSAAPSVLDSSSVAELLSGTNTLGESWGSGMFSGGTETAQGVDTAAAGSSLASDAVASGDAASYVGTTGAGASAAGDTATAAAGDTVGAGTALGYVGGAKTTYDTYEKYKAEEDTGGEVGTAVGSAAGAVYGGPIGMSAGAQAGGAVGSEVGGWLADFDQHILGPAGDTLASIFGW